MKLDKVPSHVVQDMFCNFISNLNRFCSKYKFESYMLDEYEIIMFTSDGQPWTWTDFENDSEIKNYWITLEEDYFQLVG